ncbi:ankyrin repeat-containing domain protein [Xylariales sp. PMI_506]|nr:ankyrin repeat-containing domain protein [Xylariales sp. PMI_506]
MSFGFSIGDFLAIVELAIKVRKDFSGAPTQFQQITTEYVSICLLSHLVRCALLIVRASSLHRIRNLAFILQDVEAFLSENELSESQNTSLGEIVHNTSSILTDTQTTLNKYKDLEPSDGSVGRSAKRVWKRFTWEPDIIRDLRGRIAANVASLNFFIQGYTRDNVIRLVQQEDHRERQIIFQWLTPIDYAAIQSDFIRQRESGTGQWLLDSPEFQHWMATEKETLFCHGIPGSGKTILTSIVVESLLNTFHTDPSVGICYIYCNFNRHNEQQLGDLMLSLLKQLSQAQSGLNKSVKRLYDRSNERGTRPTLDQVCETLRVVAAGFSRVFVVVDALDECSVSCRGKFITEILSLQSQIGVNVLATSRSIPDISDRFIDHTSKNIRASDEDISRYIDENIALLPGFVNRNLKLRSEIKQSIMKLVDGMFLLAKLHLESLRGKRSIKAIRTALATIATGCNVYDTAYQSVMERIQGQLPDQRDIALQTLAWITCAKRTLTKLELQHALGVELESPDLDEENLPDLEDLVSYCCGLVTIDEESDAARLVHYTAQEYFERTQGTWFPDAHGDITGACITYLSFDAFASGACATDLEYEKRLESYPLYSYAANFWGVHARCGVDPQCCSTFLAMRPHVEASSQALFVYKWQWPHSDYSQDFTKGITGMHLTAYFGLREAMMLIMDVEDPNAADAHNRTPLSYASERGEDKVVELLLSEGVDIDISATSFEDMGMTPLLFAACHAHEVVIRLLLEKGANPNLEIRTYPNHGRTPLMCAVLRGLVSLVELMLQKGARVDARSRRRNEIGMTPLLFAVSTGCVKIVQLLLEAHATINPRPSRFSSEYSTPLSFATRLGREDLVRLLLEAGAEVDAADVCGFEAGRTPLSFAAGHGNRAIARLLLEAGAEVDSRNTANATHGRTPLSFAAEGGHEAVLNLLLEKGAEIDSYATGARDFERTPLAFASTEGLERAVNLLLEKGANILGRGGTGWSPLFAASSRGHTSIVENLLDRGADMTATDKNGWTSLDIASYYGHVDVVELLLNRGADIGTSLISASSNGHINVVELLLHRGADITVTNEDGRTPLNFASCNGHIGVVELLLNRGADMTDTDKDGWTLLKAASCNGHINVVELLMSRGADMTVLKKDGATSVKTASSDRDFDVFELHLNRGPDIIITDGNVKSSINAASCSGYASVLHPLHPTAEFGTGRIVQLFPAQQANAGVLCCQGRPPVFYALPGGHYGNVGGVVLAQEGVNAGSNDIYVSTPRSIKAGLGHIELIRLLSALSDAGVGFTGSQWPRSAMIRHTRQGHPNIVQYLLQGVPNLSGDATQSHVPFGAPVQYPVKYSGEGSSCDV